MGFPGVSMVKNCLPINAGDAGSVPGWEDPLEKEMATHSSVLAWEIPRTEEPGGLQSMWLDTAELLSMRMMRYNQHNTIHFLKRTDYFHFSYMHTVVQPSKPTLGHFHHPQKKCCLLAVTPISL